MDDFFVAKNIIQNKNGFLAKQGRMAFVMKVIKQEIVFDVSRKIKTTEELQKTNKSRNDKIRQEVKIL